MKPETKIKKARKILEDIWKITEEDDLQWELNKATDAISKYIKEVDLQIAAKCEKANISHSYISNMAKAIDWWQCLTEKNQYQFMQKYLKEDWEIDELTGKEIEKIYLKWNSI